MVRTALVLSFVFSATASFAEPTKEEACGYQGQIAGAVRQARLDGVKERRAEETVVAGNPGWPENYNNAVPLLVSWIYQMDNGTLKDNDLGALWTQQCIDNWDTIQEMVAKQAG
jgi:hypothetical protein